MRKKIHENSFKNHRVRIASNLVDQKWKLRLRNSSILVWDQNGFNHLIGKFFLTRNKPILLSEALNPA